ncbi:SRPBCC family protein [Undibacterium sp. Ren11W]|uniref:SRPBCC family protein n=1 Tax=Undibacterium sp. Ren11W TaxID=3413045 RepID=UPI003BF0D08F
MAGNTIHLHRVLRAPPERVYRAFLNAEAMSKWLPPNGYTASVHHMDAQVGGSFRMSFINFATQHSQSFSGEYLELIPNQLLRYTDQFDDPNLPGTIQVTITLKAVSCGTDLSIVQEGIPEVIPVEMCYLGWQDSLLSLAKLVEAEVQ